jgi:hypothetical protein
MGGVRRSITVALPGHLATCPRMTKAASAFVENGYRVRVVSALLSDRYRAMDETIAARSGWEWEPLECSRDRAWFRWVASGVRHKAAAMLACRVGCHRAPWSVAAAAFTRLHAEIVQRVAAVQSDLYYGGGGGALAAVAEAASQNGVAYALDLEDFHTGDRWTQQTGYELQIAERIERHVLSGAAFITAGSPAIARAYTEKYHVHTTPVCNTFSLPRDGVAAPTIDGPLRAYWFSQTLGPGRGLEDVIRAAGLADVPMHLTLRAAPLDGYYESLIALAASNAPRLTLSLLPIADASTMVALCRDHHIGVGVEPGSSMSNRLALSNKLLTYVLAGLALVITNTPGQRPIIDDVVGDAVVFEPGDVGTLAGGLRRWALDPSSLKRAMAASWRAARERWHWEHPLDRGELLKLVADAL